MFNLRIPITRAAIEDIKAYLWNELAFVKSSHRLEAVARGLLFRSYAAMLHSAKSSSQLSDGFDSALFSSYLRKHGFDVAPVYLYRAAAYVAVSAALAKVPLLSSRGYGVGRPQWDFDKKRRETPGEQYAKFADARTELLSQHSLDEFLLAFAFAQRIPPTKTVQGGMGSYRLKHIAENMAHVCADGVTLGPRYVSNGALIAAALSASFKMKTYLDHLGYDHINVSFNMSKTCG